MLRFRLLKLATFLFLCRGTVSSIVDDIFNEVFDISSDWSETSCGKIGVDEEQGYIVGGRDVIEGEVPWQISLQKHFEKDNGIYHICGGTIIHKDWVLTAAHCIRLSQLDSYRIVSGTTELLNENKVKSGKRNNYFAHKVVDAHIHKDFSPFNLQNDIALLKIEPSFPISKANGRVQAACLPSPLHHATGYATVSGWGTLKEGERVIPNKLQSVRVPIISDEDCKKAYGNQIVESMICAGYEEGMRDSCQGDSGGPLFQKESGKGTIIGVVSWGMGCARPKHPGVYTEVSHYINWIHQMMNSDETFFDDINKIFFR